MEIWRENWRGISHNFSTKGLNALRLALLTNEPKLRPGMTVFRGDDNQVEGACAIGYAFWKGEEQDLDAAAISNKFYVGCSTSTDGFLMFANWFDGNDISDGEKDCFTDRKRLLLYEVNRELTLREDQYENNKEDSVCQIPSKVLMSVG